MGRVQEAGTWAAGEGRERGADFPDSHQIDNRQAPSPAGRLETGWEWAIRAPGLPSARETGLQRAWMANSARHTSVRGQPLG